VLLFPPKLLSLSRTFQFENTLYRSSIWSLHMILLRSEIPSGMCAKLRTVAASNN